MYSALYQQINHLFPFRFDIEGDTGLYIDTMVLILSLQIVLLTCVYFSIKTIIFVWLLPFSKVFVLLYLQFYSREPVAGFFKLHRLLYFIRAVDLPTSEVATALEWAKA